MYIGSVSSIRTSRAYHCTSVDPKYPKVSQSIPKLPILFSQLCLSCLLSYD